MQAEIEKVIRFQEDSASTSWCTASPSATTWSSTSASRCDGYVFTENAWVQSYGSRYVRPPIIFGDVCGRRR